jgi:hypothetical protein
MKIIFNRKKLRKLLLPQLREPMTDEDVIIKFNSLSEDVLSSKKQKKIQDAVFNFEKLKIIDFMETLEVKQLVLL